VGEVVAKMKVIKQAPFKELKPGTVAYSRPLRHEGAFILVLEEGQYTYFGFSTSPKPGRILKMIEIDSVYDVVYEPE